MIDISPSLAVEAYFLGRRIAGQRRRGIPGDIPEDDPDDIPGGDTGGEPDSGGGSGDNTGGDSGGDSGDNPGGDTGGNVYDNTWPIEWNTIATANGPGKVVSEDGTLAVFKISDITPTAEEVGSAKLTAVLTVDGVTTEGSDLGLPSNPSEDVGVISDIKYVIFDDAAWYVFLLICTTPGVDLDRITLPEAGIYYALMSPSYDFVSPDSVDLTLKLAKPNVLDNTYPIEWTASAVADNSARVPLDPENPNYTLIKVSDLTPTIEDLAATTATLTITNGVDKVDIAGTLYDVPEGNDFGCMATWFFNANELYMLFVFVANVANIPDESGMEFPETGVYYAFINLSGSVTSFDGVELIFKLEKGETA